MRLVESQDGAPSSPVTPPPAPQPTASVAPAMAAAAPPRENDANGAVASGPDPAQTRAAARTAPRAQPYQVDGQAVHGARAATSLPCSQCAQRCEPGYRSCTDCGRTYCVACKVDFMSANRKARRPRCRCRRRPLPRGCGLALRRPRTLRSRLSSLPARRVPALALRCPRVHARRRGTPAARSHDTAIGVRRLAPRAYHRCGRAPSS